ncbi:hypothetical protein N7454_007526 [Penicillium verhagenii]|nr:hypothetical protein N7454_007526 [Penicillium verhagenii]
MMIISNIILKWNITHYDRSAVAPGYWFTAPYWQHDGDRDTGLWVPYQIGPHIFDEDGVRVYSYLPSIVLHTSTDHYDQVLVWAGSAESENRPSFDFKPIDLSIPGIPESERQQYLAWMYFHEPYAPESNGSVIIHDNHYNQEREISLAWNQIDTHDFHVIDHGSKALMISISRDEPSLVDFGQPELTARIDNSGFIELDLLAQANTTTHRLVDWSPLGRVSLDESYVINETNIFPDFMHANAIDKNKYGDYLLSARHTSTIYLISGLDGHIIWRLGGKKNDFAKNFNFFGQHDARFISVNETHYVISMMQNGAIEGDVRQPVSSALLVELDVENMEATLLRRYRRPDGGSTPRRGNAQRLPNSNFFACWSEQSYVSEYSPDGRLIMEARLASKRLNTYRAYKYPWVGRPLYPPTLLSQSHGVNGSELSTVFHVSWNGATDIAYWRFFAHANSTSNRTEIGLVRKEGFETSFIARGFMDFVSVEALDSNMAVMGKTFPSRTPGPEYWSGETLPTPDDPVQFLVGHNIKVPASRDIGALFGLFVAGVFSSAFLWAVFSYRHALNRYAIRCYSNLVLTSAGYLPISTTSPLNSPSPVEEITFLMDKA